ncbi:enoyl-CoA hydratase [Antrihabitans sp. YC2-6]|uniref:enoyl-CoA hydratase n=1 Tax=Antrihabitans sp. YC2-6 TaxID=2799498 RepID=UPI0018F4858B|nr:enoyl-CoA hydratase [Antrihabitans sp. YC2-6]MBJ8345145.1 enoyl-CoA hydratase [Antrihabitans sp. YC2-6]
MTDHVSTEKQGCIGFVTLDKPAQRNPLSVAMMTDLTEAVRALGADSDVAVVVIRANGPAFSAGHDLRELVDRTLEDEREIFRVCTELMNSIQAIPQPVIAAVQGTAVAAGCQLVATCDLAVASSAAVFGTPGVKIGLFCSTPMVAVSRAIGRKRALQLLLTGSVISADTAADWGLINEVVAPADLADRVHELANAIAAASSSTLRIGKQAFYRQIELPQEQAYEAMQEVMATNAVTCDAQEGMSAFIGKRDPVWQGR